MECVLEKNGVRMYYIDGKHVSRQFAELYSQKNGKRLSGCREISDKTHSIRMKKRINLLKSIIYKLLNGEKVNICYTSLQNAKSLDKQTRIEKFKYELDMQDLKEVYKNILIDIKTNTLLSEDVDKKTYYESIAERVYGEQVNLNETKVERKFREQLDYYKEKVNELDYNEKELKTIIERLEQDLTHVENEQIDKEMIRLIDQTELKLEKEKILTQLKQIILTDISGSEKRQLEQKLGDLNYKLAKYKVMKDDMLIT